MQVTPYVLGGGRLRVAPVLAGQPPAAPAVSGETWLDVQDAAPEELNALLAPLGLHPVQLARCLDTANSPGVVSFGKVVLMEYPAAADQATTQPAYLTILLQEPVLLTVRHGAMPALDALVRDLTGAAAPPLLHLPQIIYMILDQFADLNVQAQVAIREQILLVSNSLAENPGAVRAADLALLRTRVEALVSLVENQLYCISGLNASDNPALQDAHRKAYIQDMLSETEITQRGVYRLETRVRDLYSDYQALGSALVEKRLRLLTIISAITLPLALVAGLLGMNVGGVPGVDVPSGFAIVMVLMVAIVVAEYWYFRSHGWFD